ncbi:MAG TPA: DUF1566 domain-containing protein [Gammaproteobacteria bacterium]|nr:DUF1566 domain-containing protein [Gammaproteobacteria bacterium]
MRIHSCITTVAAFVLMGLTAMASAQSCVSTIPDATPDSRYKVNSNGTVVDLRTGLMWMRCAVGQSWDSQKSSCTGTASKYNWQNALLAVQKLDNGNGYAGYNDWRLPNYRELTSIVRFRCHDPAINETIFPNTPSDPFWTSTPLAQGFGVDWSVHFLTGQAGYMGYSNKQPIRLVRGGAFGS